MSLTILNVSVAMNSLQGGTCLLYPLVLCWSTLDHVNKAHVALFEVYPDDVETIACIQEGPKDKEVIDVGKTGALPRRTTIYVCVVIAFSRLGINRVWLLNLLVDS